ncbi:protein NRT1/ PTR FAMILY 2.3-like [Andrographis paniculata]|uniref:protein NRT1/ PTR FAMILY 2.3-like n=1 Tax=Andrographis paniculata TaxID=175694 RepID=UPI0021E8A702|nr:protein NRT1/ PTR FAMILY 2.3-like [Andrographis paniculata]
MAPITGTATAPENKSASSTTSHGGGWSTAPFILASVVGMTVASGGWLNNLIVFLIQEFNIKNIDAAQISNFVNACTSFFPVAAAIIADAFLGCFSVIWISCFVSFLGLILLVLTVTISGLRPPDCKSESSSCACPSGLQYAVLYTALALVSIGAGATRFTLGTMGANQFARPDHQSTYFNWYFIALYGALFASATAIVYVEDNVSWFAGYAICASANVIGLVSFLAGKRYYRHDRPHGSPFASLARVVVATFRKRKLNSSSSTVDYYYGEKGVEKAAISSLRLLNRAAIITEGDIAMDGSIAKPWKLCTMQQVEDLKTLIRILPLWSSSIFLSTPIGIQVSLTVLQALATDRHLGPGRHFQFPAGSMIIFTFLATVVCLGLFGHCLWPLWKRVTGKQVTSLQQLGLGHALTIGSMAVSALVESKRRRAQSPISVLWLVPQMAIVGSGEACHFPGQVRFYYQEFPSSLKSMSTAMISMLIGIGFYLSTALVDLVRRATAWLPDDIDEGRVDNVYWMLVVIGVLNFGYFLGCCWFFKNKNGDDE